MGRIAASVLDDLAHHGLAWLVKHVVIHLLRVPADLVEALPHDGRNPYHLYVLEQQPQIALPTDAQLRRVKERVGPFATELIARLRAGATEREVARSLPGRLAFAGGDS